MELKLEQIGLQHQDRLIAASILSKELHANWVSAPMTASAFSAQLKKYDNKSNLGYMVVNDQDQLVAWISITQIARGNFQSAYIGYCVFVPFEGKGLMRKALKMLMEKAFGELRLHRLEANIQPENKKSSDLIKAIGFRLEGYSQRYLKIEGLWRDHERYAITAEEF